MVQAHFILVVSLTFFCSTLPDFLDATSEEKQAVVGRVAHVPLQPLETSRSKKTEVLDRVSSNILSSGVPNNKWRRSISTQEPTLSTADQMAAEREDGSTTEGTTPIPLNPMAQVVLEVTRTVQTLSQSVQHLSDDVRKQSTTIAEVLNAFRGEAAERFTKTESALSQRLKEFENFVTEKLTTMESALCEHSKLSTSDPRIPYENMIPPEMQDAHGTRKIEPVLQHYAEDFADDDSTENTIQPNDTALAGHITDLIENVSRNLELSERRNTEKFDSIQSALEQLQDAPTHVRHYGNLSNETCGKLAASIQEQIAHFAEFKRDMTDTIRSMKSFTRNETERTIEGMADDLQSLVVSATNTIHILTKLDAVIPDAVQNMTRDLASTSSTLLSVAGNTPNGLQRLESSISMLNMGAIMKDPKEPMIIASSAHPTAFFHVQNITQHTEKLEASRKGINISSGRYIIDGYTARLELGLSFQKNILWIGTYFHLCPGSKDSFLQWPFRTNVTLSIFHPRDATKDVRKTVKTTQLHQCLNSVRKPGGECNKGCGFNQVLPYELAKKVGYLNDDAITIGATFHSQRILAQ